MDKTAKFAEFIKSSNNIVVFSGAGISCASGIPDFRSDNGLYNQPSGFVIRPEEIISHSFFMRNTKDFYSFYRSKMVYENAKPNVAHQFFADLQKEKNVSVVTQNIDGLHQLAGSKNVYELHGSIFRNYCMDCHRFYDLQYIMSTDDVPKCPSCGGTIKPDVVLYEESLDADVINGALNAITHADCMIIIGTSLTVYPAASFVQYYKGNKLVLINKQATGLDNNVDLIFNEDVVKVINDLKKYMSE